MANEPNEDKERETPVWLAALKQTGVVGLFLLALRLVAGILYAMDVLPL